MAKNLLASIWYAILGIFGYKRSYSFILFFIFAGGLFGFTLARLQYLNLGRFKQNVAPGEWYYFRQDLYQTGIMLHLSTILPCSMLVVLQFVPKIRQKAILFHRINGYAIVLLFLTSNAGALIVAPHSFGGQLHVQYVIGLVVFCSTVSVLLALINIRRKQIEQHRAWMLRAMFYMGSIVTIRPVMSICGDIFASMSRAYYTVWPCDQISYTWQFYDIPVSYLTAYPMCNATSQPPELAGTTELVAPVKADPNAPDPIAIGATLQFAFGLSFWVAVFLHFAGIELYLHLTPRENQRLRVLSYKRQLEKKYRNPGSAGLVAQKLGDADEWDKPSLQSDEGTPLT